MNRKSELRLDAESHIAAQSLSEYHWEILDCLRKGMSSKAIAAELNRSEPTVKYHLTRIYRILGVSSRFQALIAIQSLPERVSNEDYPKV